MPPLPRSAEAERLEADYLKRLKQVLTRLPNELSVDIFENVNNHISAALAGYSGEVSLSQMAQVLEELGPPESFVEEEAPPSQPPPIPEMNHANNDSRQELSESLHLLYTASIILVIGIWIPLIDLYLFDIIACFLISKIVLSPAHKRLDMIDLGSSAKICAWSLVGLFVFSVLEALSPLWGLIGLPFAIASLVYSLVMMWQIYAGLKRICQQVELSSFSTRIEKARNTYFTFLIISISIGILLAAIVTLSSPTNSEVSIEVMSLLLLPVNWFFGWMFFLKPLKDLQKQIESPITS